MRLFLTISLASLLVFSFTFCSKSTTNPVEEPKRWEPTDPAQGGTGLQIYYLMGYFPDEYPGLPYQLPVSGNLRTAFSKVMRGNADVNGLHIYFKQSGGDSVFLKCFTDLDSFYLPTMALPLYPPDILYPFEIGQTYSIKFKTDQGEANGSVVMPYIDMSYPSASDTVISLSSIQNAGKLTLRWTTNYGTITTRPALGIVQITGSSVFGPLPIPLPYAVNQVDIPANFFNTGNMTVYVQALNLDTVSGNILLYDTIILPGNIDTIIGNYTFPAATYVSYRKIRIN
ncbi:hypothetical protein JXA84_07645 [candidate division WOR-3 bacterium]|nr:hypothetical protein [candidate division WOR-3 bacterium]